MKLREFCRWMCLECPFNLNSDWPYESNEPFLLRSLGVSFVLEPALTMNTLKCSIIIHYVLRKQMNLWESFWWRKYCTAYQKISQKNGSLKNTASNPYPAANSMRQALIIDRPYLLQLQIVPSLIGTSNYLPVTSDFVTFLGFRFMICWGRTSERRSEEIYFWCKQCEASLRLHT